MRLRISTLVATAVFVLVGSEAAYAWGPATHVGLAASVLEQLYLLPVAIGTLLARHGVAYLYGNIAADVVFAKRWSRVKQSCHHWSTAFRLHEAARNDQDRAFSYGYLSHLAADTVAHSKFIPRQVMLSQCTVNFGHMFWELRADATANTSTWNLLERVLAADHAHHHQSLSGHMAGTFLPYGLNRRLFDQMNALAMRRAFRRTVDVWSRRSRWRIAPGLVDAYRAESLDRILSLLIEGDRSPVLREDPNGTPALMHLRVHRRDVRRLKRRGLPVKPRVREAARGLAPRRATRVLADLVEPLADPAVPPVAAAADTPALLV